MATFRRRGDVFELPAGAGHVGAEVFEAWLVVDDPVDDLGQEAGFGLKRGPLVGWLVVLFAPRFGPVPESLDGGPRVSGSSVPSSKMPLTLAVVVRLAHPSRLAHPARFVMASPPGH